MSLTSFVPSALQDRRLLYAAPPLAYLALVRALRYQREAYHARVLKRNDGTLADMSVATAQQIWTACGNREFPQLFQLGLSFALFRTYGIPSISALLAATGRLARADAIDQRLADTAALVIEFTSRPIYGAEWTEALARLNCIHDHYIAQGRIAMDDMRYTLALFALEPPRWTARYDWRAYSAVERCATGVLWRALGEAMGISWVGLASYDAATAARHDTTKAWRDGTHFLDELAAWTEAYEAAHMVPADTNAAVAGYTAQQLLSSLPIPQRLQESALPVLAALMDTRLRTAMRFEAPSARVQRTVDGVMGIRRFVLRHLTLPRPYFLRYQSVSARDEHGRVNLSYYTRAPYYVRPTLWNRWLNPIAWLKRLKGLPVPGPQEFQPEGYVPREVGPRIARERQDAMESLVTERVGTIGTCPFGHVGGGKS